jgi:hypothetical protein
MKYLVPLIIHANAYIDSDDDSIVTQLAEDAVTVESVDDGVIVQLDSVDADAAVEIGNA